MNFEAMPNQTDDNSNKINELAANKLADNSAEKFLELKQESAKIDERMKLLEKERAMIDEQMELLEKERAELKEKAVEAKKDYEEKYDKSRHANFL